MFSGVTATESSLGGLPGQAEGAAPHKIQRLHKQTQIEEDPITNTITNTNTNTNTRLQKQTKIENDLITKTKTNAKTAKKRGLLPMGPVLHYILLFLSWKLLVLWRQSINYHGNLYSLSLS